MDTELYNEIEKLAHYYNTYIVANDITDAEVNAASLSLINNMNYNAYHYNDKDMVSFFLRITQNILLKYDNESMRHSMITYFYSEFAYFQSFSSERFKHQSFFGMGLYFTFGTFFYNLLIAAILKRHYTPYLSYNQWKKYYNSYK